MKTIPISFINEFAESTAFLFPTEKPLKIFYIHGFASQFDFISDKVIKLARLGMIEGKTWDYTFPHEFLKEKMGEEISKGNYDLIVGSSLGGYWASQMGSSYGIPFVSINPAINPAETLKKYIGKGVTHFGELFELKSSVVNGYGQFAESGKGLILLDLEDEVLDSNETKKRFENKYKVLTFDGGNHRFTHIEESLSLIRDFILDAENNH